MITVKIISTSLGDLGKRLIKFAGFGSKDIQTAQHVFPFGIDSNPVKDWVAVYATTSNSGDKIIVGVINKNLLAGIGETRLFATDDKGTEKGYLWLKNDGTAEILGNDDNAVRFSKLEAGFNQLKDDLNTQIDKWNLFAAAYSPGSPTTLGTPPTAATVTNSTASISDAKIDTIKVPSS